jgi:hypothetical protein
VEALYTILVKIDETLPWIELQGIYQTRKAAQEALSNIRTKIVEVPEKKRQIRALVTVR